MKLSSKGKPSQRFELRNPPSTWGEVEFRDIVFAYRKAKADAFFERQLPCAEIFSRFEGEGDGLISKLRNLHKRLKQGPAELQKILNAKGDFYLVPKKLKRSPKKQSSESNQKPNGHSFISNPTRAFAKAEETEDFIPCFRTLEAPSVEFRIIAALWINWMGHRYDACLEESAYGSRLRRFKAKDTHDKKVSLGKYHLSSPCSFAPYFGAYKSWRENGLSKVREELKADRSVIVLTLDLKSFYHNIDPTFIINKGFFPSNEVQSEWDSLRKNQQKVGLELNTAIAKAYLEIEKRIQSKLMISDLPVGLPLGDSAARVMANVLMQPWDKAVREKVTPLHYGRYVDDMFFVLRDPGNLNTGEEVMARINEMMGNLLEPQVNGEWKIDLGKTTKGESWQKESKLTLQDGKHKVFFLSGRAGLDLLESVEKEINDVASERHLLPDPDFLERSPGAKALTAAGSPSVEADTFGRAEGLTLRRLGWSIQLRNAETLADDLPSEKWSEQRQRFYEFAKDHVLNPLSIFDHAQSLSRLMGLAIRCDDGDAAEALESYANKSFKRLIESPSVIKFEVNGISIDKNTTFPIKPPPPDYSHFMKRIITEAKLVNRASSTSFLKRKKSESSPDPKLAWWCANADLGRVPYKELRLKKEFWETDRKKLMVNQHSDDWGMNDEISVIQNFIDDACSSGLAENAAPKNESILPFIFPTRPHLPDEIAELAPNCVINSNPETPNATSLWKNYVKALRGTWVSPGKPEDKLPLDIDLIRLGGSSIEKVKIALVNLRTSNATWTKTAAGAPDLSAKRYKEITTLINLVLRLPKNQRPDYLVLPELALPQRWLKTISNRLFGKRINLIAGLEYRHLQPISRKTYKRVVNEVALTLIDHRLGYPSQIRIRHQKANPAPKEEHDLLNIHKRNWDHGSTHHKRVYEHNGLTFGILICSELQSIEYLSKLRGKIDALFVPSWNTDLKTFSPVIEAAAFGVHCHVIYSNNGIYGDCRVRTPDKTDYLQDSCRIRGGINPYVAVVEIDIDSLRAFQSRHKTGISKDEPYKPLPDGFRIAKFRRRTPAE